MILIDANVILRFILRDHQEMHRKAEQMIATEKCYTLPEVIGEVVYVLEKFYKVDRMVIRDSVSDLFDRVMIADPLVVINALDLYARLKVDYVDGILISRALLFGENVFSFDQKVQKLIGRGRAGETL